MCSNHLLLSRSGCYKVGDKRIQKVPPCEFLQFLGRQVLLVGALLEVEDDEQGVRLSVAEVSGEILDPNPTN